MTKKNPKKPAAEPAALKPVLAETPRRITVDSFRNVPELRADLRALIDHPVMQHALSALRELYRPRCPQTSPGALGVTADAERGLAHGHRLAQGFFGALDALEALSLRDAERDQAMLIAWGKLLKEDHQ